MVKHSERRGDKVGFRGLGISEVLWNWRNVLLVFAASTPPSFAKALLACYEWPTLTVEPTHDMRAV